MAGPQDEYVMRWRLVAAKAPESCRWECVDGRWVSLTLGQEDRVGMVAVKDSSGRSEFVDSYEGALQLAKAWRT
jgi:hypothetical protein